MHDLDRTQSEAGEPEWGGFELDSEFGSYELEGYELDGAELEGAFGVGELEAADHEMLELEAASDLLEVASEAELEEFLGNLVSKASSLAGQALRSSAGQAVVGVLKDAAKTAIPQLGARLGAALVPGRTGARFGRALGQRATNWLGLELEGLSPEDQEFELARAFVRFATETARRACRLPTSVPPRQAAKKAAAEAARRIAPALVPVIAASSADVRRGRSTRRRTGRWYRRGQTIVIDGV